LEEHAEGMRRHRAARKHHNFLTSKDFTAADVLPAEKKRGRRGGGGLPPSRIHRGRGSEDDGGDAGLGG